jgi:hypothetical protein
MVRCWGFWGKLGVWDTFRGCFAGSGRVRRRSGGVGGRSGPGEGVVAGVAVVVGDLVAVLGVSRGMGDRGTCWGVVGGERGVRWGWWGKCSCSAE